MKVNQEVDALRTLGLDPIEVLVLPRAFGLMMTLPLLVFFADTLALMGGGLMSSATLGITEPAFLEQLRRDHDRDFRVGVIKAPFFASLSPWSAVTRASRVGQRRERRAADDPLGRGGDLSRDRLRRPVLDPVLDIANLTVREASTPGVTGNDF